jgi:hypothetical protein
MTERFVAFSRDVGTDALYRNINPQALHSASTSPLHLGVPVDISVTVSVPPQPQTTNL